MQGYRHVFEGSLFMLGCFTGVTCVILLMNPSVDALQFVWQYGRFPFGIVIAALYLGARGIACTRTEFISYSRVVLFVIGGLFTLFGVISTVGNLVGDGTQDQTLNTASVLAVGAAMLTVSWLTRRIAGTSCWPQVKSMLS